MVNRYVTFSICLNTFFLPYKLTHALRLVDQDMGMRYLSSGVGHFTPSLIDDEQETTENLEGAEQHIEGTHEDFTELTKATSDDKDGINHKEDFDHKESGDECESKSNWDGDNAIEEDVDI
ncbi:hypothetical protein BDV93DRAFT_456521 [Ceratobasidium sp. AG-I]|nr:hypothetical protein BDV93DRAFT_456521 [Ceratobasidium sp. AG-I]